MSHLSNLKTFSAFIVFALALTQDGIPKQEADSSQKRTVEPVFRVPKITSDSGKIERPRVVEPSRAIPNAQTLMSQQPAARVAEAREINAPLDKKSVDLTPDSLT
ncbi:MAG: hypothetical protein AAGA30_13300, partial [Planctomycetota bacterium]